MSFEITVNQSNENILVKYWPLFALVLYAALSAAALGFAKGGTAEFVMHAFMGIFFLIFSLLKVFNLKHFADGFQMYDLLGKRWRGYCYVYPFLELALALLYLSEAWLLPTYIFTVVLMGFSTLGVLAALKRGLKILCPCMGTVLKAPLSTVTLTEDLVMGLMAAGMLFFS